MLGSCIDDKPEAQGERVEREWWGETILRLVVDRVILP